MDRGAWVGPGDSTAAIDVVGIAPHDGPLIGLKHGVSALSQYSGTERY